MLKVTADTGGEARVLNLFVVLISAAEFPFRHELGHRLFVNRREE
jgi:hypothetical protein